MTACVGSVINPLIEPVLAVWEYATVAAAKTAANISVFISFISKHSAGCSGQRSFEPRARFHLDCINRQRRPQPIEYFIRWIVGYSATTDIHW
jgi:hypothetical protein